MAINPRLFIKLDTRADGKSHSIESICCDVTMTQSCNTADGRVEFDMLDTPDINCRFGDTVHLILDGKLIFSGKLFEIKRDADLYIRHYTFYDETFYLRNPITYPVPVAIPMILLVSGLLNKYEIRWRRLDSAGEMVSERKIQNTSILDAITEIVNYVSYMYNKMYVLRPNAGKVEFIDIECSNVSGFQNSYPLVIDFSNSETIAQQTYNYFEFYIQQEKEKPKSKSKPKSKKATTNQFGNPNKDGLGQQDTFDANVAGKLATGKSTYKNGGGGGGSSTVYKYLKPLVPYDEQAINLEIAMYAVGGVNAAQAVTQDKPVIDKDIDEEKAGYAIGSKGYKLTGEVALWGYLPMLKEVKALPPEEVVNQIINVRRNPIRSAKFTVLVHGDFHLPGDKLFIGETEELASVYVINSVTTKFTDMDVIQELDIFSWQKTFEVQKMIIKEKLQKLENAGGKEAVQTFALQNNLDLVYKKSAGEDAGYIVTDQMIKQMNADADIYFDKMDAAISNLQKVGEKATKK